MYNVHVVHTVTDTCLPSLTLCGLLGHYQYHYLFPPWIGCQAVGQIAYSPIGEVTLSAVKRGDRIAQLILECIVTPPVEEVEGELDMTARGVGGYGSTGVSLV